MQAMRFKSYTWPHNPATYRISYERRVAAQKLPFGRYLMQDLGLFYRVMRGEGELIGADAYKEFTKLAKVFYEDGPGILTHPVWTSASAYFVALELMEEPREDYVKYSFVFWEDFSRYEGRLLFHGGDEAAEAAAEAATALVHTVVRGDTLWAIARRYAVELDALLARNPQIKNPNLIHVGERVKIR